MNEDKPDRPFAELQRAVSEGEFRGPATPRQRRRLPTARPDGLTVDPIEVFVEEASTAFEERLTEYLSHLAKKGLTGHQVLGTPEEFAERAVRALLPPAE